MEDAGVKRVIEVTMEQYVKLFFQTLYNKIQKKTIKNELITVSHLSGAADHDVVAVSVSDAQNVCGYTVACT